MLTSKELEILSEYLATAKLEDLYTPDIPQVNLPSWITSDVRLIVEEQINMMASYQNDRVRLKYDVYSLFVHYFTRVIVVFTDNRMQTIWNKLNTFSGDAAKDFARVLFFIENAYDGALTLIDKHKDEIKSYKKVIALAEQLHDAMEEYSCHYYGHMTQNNHAEIMDDLKLFRIDSIRSLDEFIQYTRSDSYMSASYWPITRKCHGDKSLAIFFIRKIYHFFQRNFGKPMYNDIAHIIDVIFKLPFNENDIIKHCSMMKTIDCEDSTN